MPLTRTSLWIIATCICWASFAQAQNPKNPYNPYEDDPCGDPRVESMLWEPLTGKVAKVIDGNTLIVVHKKRRLMVHLVGIEAPRLGEPFGSSAQQFLKQIVGKRNIEVLVNPSLWVLKRPRPQTITGIVYRREGDLKDVNLALIAAGMARHKESRPYTMSSYTECKYVRAEEEARQSRRGIWQRAAEPGSGLEVSGLLG